MNDEQLNKLFAAARAERPDTARVEYGFETRLLTRLRAEQPVTAWAVWAWRLMPVCAAVVLAIGAWSYQAGPALNWETALAGRETGLTLTGVLTGD